MLCCGAELKQNISILICVHCYKLSTILDKKIHSYNRNWFWDKIAPIKVGTPETSSSCWVALVDTVSRCAPGTYSGRGCWGQSSVPLRIVVWYISPDMEASEVKPLPRLCASCIVAGSSTCFAAGTLSASGHGRNVQQVHRTWTVFACIP